MNLAPPARRTRPKLWTPHIDPQTPGLSMGIGDGPILRAAKYRVSVERDRYRIDVWEGMSNLGILHEYIDTLEGEVTQALWRAFGAKHGWSDFAPSGSGFWGAGHELVDRDNLLNMEQHGQLMPYDD